MVYINFLFCIIISLCSFSERPLEPENKSECPVRDSLLNVIYSQIGIVEATGNNDGEVEKYIEATGLNPKANLPYCVAYVYWCFLQVDIFPHVPAPAWSPSWFLDEYIVYKRTENNYYKLIPTDVFGIYFNRLGRIGHGGFLVEEEDDYYITVEANTNAKLSREGDGVWSKRRPKQTIFKISRHLLPEHCITKNILSCLNQPNLRYIGANFNGDFVLRQPMVR